MDFRPHLSGERTLAEHFENMSSGVESVSVTREFWSLKSYLDKTKKVFRVRRIWVLSQSKNVVVPHKKRFALRPGWASKKVDVIEYLESEFPNADELVRRRRRTAKLKATDSAFVTFENMSSAVSPPSSTLGPCSRPDHLPVVNCCINSPRFYPLPIND